MVVRADDAAEAFVADFEGVAVSVIPEPLQPDPNCFFLSIGIGVLIAYVLPKARLTSVAKPKAPISFIPPPSWVATPPASTSTL